MPDPAGLRQALRRARSSIAANRDEFYARPAHPARYWDGAPHVFGGRDLEAGGTWLAVSTGGRFAALTNYTDFDLPVSPAASRGDLTRRFLEGAQSAFSYAESLDGTRYQGFNLIVFDGTDLVYASNRTGDVRTLETGVYGLTNTWLGDEWPKTKRGTAALARIAATADADAVLELMVEESEGYLADGHEIESARRATPAFLRGEEYGTRASTVGHLRGRPDRVRGAALRTHGRARRARRQDDSHRRGRGVASAVPPPGGC